MRKLLVAVILCLAMVALLAAPVAAKNKECNTITEGEVFYSTGHYLAGKPIPTGFDPYGYNYQGHMFSGSYANTYLGGAGFPPYEGDTEAYLEENPNIDDLNPNGTYKYWYWPYRDVKVTMKWNDAWLSNKDRDLDGKLDRHYGYPSYIGSGAWETNHQWGTDIYDGESYNWNYFCKIVAVPADAIKGDCVYNAKGVLIDWTWYTADGIEIGPQIWNQFATIQVVWNDKYYDLHGVYYNSPAPTGFGYYIP